MIVVVVGSIYSRGFHTFLFITHSEGNRDILANFTFMSVVNVKLN